MAGSMVLHGVCAAVLLAAAPWKSGETPLAPIGSGEAIEVTLVSASTGQAAASRDDAVEPKPGVAQAVAPAEASPPTGPPTGPMSPSSAVGAEGRAQRGALDGGAAASDARPGALDPAAGADYRQRLLAHIQPFRRYPAQAHARDADARGIVQLVFLVDKGGSVMGVWVKTSSGVEVLDAEAVATILRAQPMPRVPPGLPAPLMVQLPVSFNPS